MRAQPHLPIDEVLPDVLAALERRASAVLVAPPGAGKTTRVPLALLASPWRGDGRIIVLEPRRLAARGAADRMAKTLGEPLGQTIGLRARFDVKVSDKTRIEVITEGVFARMIVDDPALTGVSAVLFDEYHERSLDADMGLALALEAQAALREDLRILVMSATLDGARVARLLGTDTPVIESEGRLHPIKTIYLGRDSRERLEPQMASAIRRALTAETGSILAFLPGQAEIRRTADLLAETLRDPSIDVAPLYGAMDRQAQDKAIEPPAPGRRKVVLATSIAETSLTIEGVRVVIDSGLSRVPVYEPGIGLTRLETQRVSRAAADQRRGRAGRTEPGICYRLWDEPQTLGLQPFAAPEITSADLTGMVLDLAAWGVHDPMSLNWLDPPPQGAVSEARSTLRALGAIDESGRMTPMGKALRSLPLPPRVARMVIQSAKQGHAALKMASEIAALLVERSLGGTSTHLDDRLQRFRSERGGRAEDMRKLAAGWVSTVRASASDHGADKPRPAQLLALAFPDRIARARGSSGQFLLVNGRAGAVEAHDALAKAYGLVVADMTGAGATARIALAAPLDEADFLAVSAPHIETAEDLTFDAATLSLRARRVRRLGAIILSSDPMPLHATPEAAQRLARGIAEIGMHRLPWGKALQQWRERVMFLHQAHRASGDDDAANPWPDVSDAALAATVDMWLAPHIEGATSVSDITPNMLHQATAALLDWSAARALEREAPTHFVAPTGTSVMVDYAAEGGPSVSIRVQELYGLKEHPTLADGRVPLTLHLLSPAHRPIQITRDLPGFWKGSWASVRIDMKGRYPRHLWPEDPAAALPTTRAKPRGT